MSESSENKLGRHTKYTLELGDLICAQIAEGKSLYTICAQEGMPAPSSVYLWVAKGDRGDPEYKPFSEQYVRAREAQCHFLMDETIPIADDATQDELFSDEGKRLCNAEFIARSKLRVDTRFRYAEKLHPKKYGTKIQQEHIGSIPVSIVDDV